MLSQTYAANVACQIEHANKQQVYVADGAMYFIKNESKTLLTVDLPQEPVHPVVERMNSPDSVWLADDSLESTDVSSCSSSSKPAARHIEVLSPLTKLEGGRKRPAATIPDLCTAAVAWDGVACSPSLMDWFGDAPACSDVAASKRKRPRCLYTALSAVGPLEASEGPSGSIEGSAPPSPAAPVAGWIREDSVVPAGDDADLYCNETLADAEMYCDEVLPQSTLESAPLRWPLPCFSGAAVLESTKASFAAEPESQHCHQYGSSGLIRSLRAPNAPLRPVLFLPGKKVLKPRALFSAAV